MCKDDSLPANGDADQITRELRYFFRKIEREEIKQEVAERSKQAKEEKRARRQAAREAAKVSRKSRKKSAAPPPLIRRCYKCNAEMPQLAAEDPPRPCFKCLEADRDNSHLIKPRKPVEYSEVEVFSGGAPGLGKRH